MLSQNNDGKEASTRSTRQAIFETHRKSINSNVRRHGSSRLFHSLGVVLLKITVKKERISRKKVDESKQASKQQSSESAFDIIPIFCILRHSAWKAPSWAARPACAAPCAVKTERLELQYQSSSWWQQSSSNGGRWQQQISKLSPSVCRKIEKSFLSRLSVVRMGFGSRETAVTRAPLVGETNSLAVGTVGVSSLVKTEVSVVGIPMALRTSGWHGGWHHE